MYQGGAFLEQWRACVQTVSDPPCLYVFFTFPLSLHHSLLSSVRVSFVSLGPFSYFLALFHSLSLSLSFCVCVCNADCRGAEPKLTRRSRNVSEKQHAKDNASGLHSLALSLSTSFLFPVRPCKKILHAPSLPVIIIPFFPSPAESNCVGFLTANTTTVVLGVLEYKLWDTAHRIGTGVFLAVVRTAWEKEKRQPVNTRHWNTTTNNTLDRSNCSCAYPECPPSHIAAHRPSQRSYMFELGSRFWFCGCFEGEKQAGSWTTATTV